ncbi:CD109 antigen-like, partial [Ruditapes philippinarum]|uniref:CD109 antigen-like n=1 Tax=Ruditapes philippinarum TaxID=129788 RepID=UPI00295A635E
MSEQPVLGMWKLKAKLLSYGEEFEEKSFEVDEYVLPKFEIELDLPSFGRTDVTKFTGKMKAKYTFGKPVKGIVDILIRPKNERFQWINGSRQRVSKVISLQMPITGEVKFTIKMTELTDIQKFLSGSTLVFEANVTDDVTKFKRSDIQEITFFSQPIKLSFLTSLPDTFKPGMTYDAVVIVAQRDDSVPDMINGKLKITITEYRKQHRRPFFMDRSRINSMESFRAWRGRRPTWQRETKKVLGPFFHAIPVDGVVVFPIETESGVKKVDVKAEYNGASTFRTLKKRHSPSNTYLQMRLLTSNPKAGSPLDLEIGSTHDIHGYLSYQIYSRGSIVESGTIPMSNRRQTWTFNVTSAMAPKAKVVLYYVRSDGEVDIKFNQTSAEPIDKISLDVKADNGSTVHVLGVDKSVLLMATGNDITESQVSKEIRRYAIKIRKTSSFSGCNWRCWRMPIPVGGEDVMDVFNDAGVIVFTDALIYKHIRGVTAYKADYPKRKTKKEKHPSRKHQSTSSNKMTPFKSKGSKEAENEAHVRKHFPETWIWSSFQIQSNGTVSIEDTVPDTITSWVATAFAIHPDSGLGISSVPAQTSISLKKSSEFDYVKIEGTKTSIASIDAFRTVTVGADEVLAVYFPIVPRKIGLVDINVQAKTPIQADAIKKKLLVEAEGTPREYNLPIVVDLRNYGTVTKTVNTEYPLRTVKGSERMTATLIGDLMGPSINGLDKLLKLPTGCGEQNMLKFAPNIYI